MAYVPVPKDLSKVKTKVAFNLTKRQLICLAGALGVGLPLFFLLKDSAGTSLAAMAMIVVMLPCFLFAMYEKHGQPLEVIAKNIIQTRFIRPKERPYRTENLYAVLVNDMIIADNLHSAIFSLAAYTVILCFSLFKSGALAKSILNAH